MQETEDRRYCSSCCSPPSASALCVFTRISLPVAFTIRNLDAIISLLSVRFLVGQEVKLYQVGIIIGG
jgi:hypothetical protein